MGHRVLIVDDADFMRMLLRKILEESGFTIIGEADNGKAAVRKYAELKPDVMTLDITMPLLSGIEALKQIREQDQTARIVMVSALGQKSMVLQALREGAAGFIIKPFEKEKVVAALQDALKNVPLPEA